MPNWPGHLTLGQFCTEMDREFGMETGVTLFLMHHLLAIKSIRCDMNQPLDDTVLLHCFEVVGTKRAEAVR